MKALAYLTLMLMLTINNIARADDSFSAGSWQMSRLFDPTDADIASERKGRVMIYDGLTDKTVDRAMDEQFDRIEAMMFTRTVVTNDVGEPLLDPESGDVIVEDDGCD